MRIKMSLANLTKIDEEEPFKEQRKSLISASKSTRYNSGETCRSASSFDGSSSGLGTDEATSGKGSAHGGDDEDSDAVSDEMKEVTVKLIGEQDRIGVARFRRSPDEHLKM